jgi:hypothetical protein
LIQHRAPIVGDERDHRPCAALEAHVEAPLLPLDEVAVDAEVRTVRLRDAQGLERRSQPDQRADAGLVELVRCGGHRHDSAVEHLQHTLIVEIDDGLHALDRPRVEIDAGALGVVHLCLHDAALFLRQPKAARRERRHQYLLQLLRRPDAAPCERMQEGRVLEREAEVDHLCDRQSELTLRARNELPRREAAGLEVHHALEALLVLTPEHGRLPATGPAAEHLGLRRFTQLDALEDGARLGRATHEEYVGGTDDLVRRERVQRVRADDSGAEESNEHLQPTGGGLGHRGLLSRRGTQVTPRGQRCPLPALALASRPQPDYGNSQRLRSAMAAPRPHTLGPMPTRSLAPGAARATESECLGLRCHLDRFT